MNLDQFLSEYKYSKIESEFPDEDKFPLFYKARKTVCELNEGEMLFIPAGMFHMVFSCNDGFNFAVNYWYKPITGPGAEHKIEKHNIPNMSLQDINQIFDGGGDLEVYKSKTNLFPANVVQHRYSNIISQEYMTFDEFMLTKNKHYYIVQGSNDYFLQHTPKYDSPLEMCKIWANFGGSTTTLLHFDGHDNWLCQIKGKKRVLLFPNEDRDLLYMWNPAPINIINEIRVRTEYFWNFVIHLNNHIDDNLCNELSSNSDQKETVIKNNKIQQVLLNVLKIYDNHTQLSNFQTVMMPWQFKVVNTLNRDYVKFNPNYPYIFMGCLRGRGCIMINGRKFNFTKGQVFIGPNSFIFNTRVQGDVSFITI